MDPDDTGPSSLSFQVATDPGALHPFCSRCGQALEPGTRGGDERPSCPACGYIQTRYPAVGVAVVLRDEAGRILMGRRIRGRRAGLWCIPCGYVEWGEDVRDAARRELLEETGLEVELGDVFAVHSNFHNPELFTVGIWFSGRIISGNPHPADGELTAIAYFDPSDPPPLAFPTDGLVLEQLGRPAPLVSSRSMGCPTSPGTAHSSASIATVRAR